MSKYIDAEKLIAEINRLVKVNKELKYSRFTEVIAAGYGDVLSAITSLQQEQMDELLVPIWCLKNIENTLQIEYNIHCEKETGETCQDRNIKACLNSVTKILNGEELTGMERLEPLKEKPEVDLEKEIQEHLKECLDVKFPTTDTELIKKDVAYTARKFYELGLNARKEK